MSEQATPRTEKDVATMNGTRWWVELPDGTTTAIHPGICTNPDVKHTGRNPMRWSCQYVDADNTECHAPAHYRHDAPKNWTVSVDQSTAQTNPVGALSALWCRKHVPVGGYNTSSRRRVLPPAATGGSDV